MTFWTPGEDFAWGNGVEHVTPEHSPLPATPVVRALAAQDGSWWFGTDAGLLHDDGTRWVFFTAEDMGLPEARIRALWEGPSGQVWVGTLRGAAVLEAAGWRALPELAEVAVFAITGDAQRVWFGTDAGLSWLERDTQQWTHLSRAELNLTWGGVADVLVDRNGTVWAATQGNGVLRWDGTAWQQITVSQGLPSNTARCLGETPDGTIWVGVAYPTEPGGLVVAWDGTRWRKQTARNSGYAEFEPLAFATDAEGRLWIATALGGVQTYRAP